MPKKNVNLFVSIPCYIAALLLIDFSIFKFNLGSLNNSFYLGFWQGPIAFISVILVLILAVALLVRSKSLPVLPKILISVGVVTNLIERAIFGGVVDYIPFFHLTVFNIADVLITIGFMFVLLIIWGKEKK
ncbi:MAG: signal peptidase II [Patescibacteria group bacterium]|jgi:lipoprotein signal peptidase